MTNLMFEGLTFEDPAPQTTDLTCELCQNPLTYTGRGRKPKRCSASNGGDPECFGNVTARPATSSGPRVSARQSKNVETALAVMEGVYDGISEVLILLSPDGAVELEKRVVKQQLRNKACFESSPALCERVARYGGKGGTFAFLLSNLSMLAMVAFTVYNGTSAQMAMFQQMASMMNNGAPQTPPEQFDLGKIFNMG